MTKGRVPKKVSEAGCDARDLVPLAPVGPVIAMCYERRASCARCEVRRNTADRTTQQAITSDIGLDPCLR